MSRLPDRATLARVLPFAVFMAFLALRGAAPPVLWGFDTRWLYGVGVLAVAAVLWHHRRDYRELTRVHRPTAAEALLAVGVGLAVFAAWIRLDAPWMSIDAGAVSYLPTDAAGRIDWPLVAVRWIGAALLVPVMEELFWRGWLMRWIERPDFESVDPRHVGAKAVLLSTLAFVLVHALWLAAIVAGLAYAWLYWRSGKLWLPVIAHAVTNGALGVWVVATGNWQFW